MSKECKVKYGRDHIFYLNTHRIHYVFHTHKYLQTNQCQYNLAILLFSLLFCHYGRKNRDDDELFQIFNECITKNICVCKNLWYNLMVMMQRMCVGQFILMSTQTLAMMFFFLFFLLEQKVFQPMKELFGSHPNHTKI